MRVFMIGDVVGKAGRQAVQDRLSRLKSAHGVDFIICNAENAAAGIGITSEIARAFLDQGIQALTLGNHAWGKREVYTYMDAEARLLRPANYPPGAPGQGYGVFPGPGGPIGVVSLQGRTFMEAVDDPFRAIDVIIEELQAKTRAIVIDFHAEATSEKQAFACYVDGRVSAVIGTHTHVQTADERILPGGTAYLTDVGMTGPIHSIIGMKCDIILARFTTLLPARFEVAEGEAQLCGVLIDIDMETGRATHIQRVQAPTFAEIREARA